MLGFVSDSSPTANRPSQDFDIDVEVGEEEEQSCDDPADDFRQFSRAAMVSQSSARARLDDGLDMELEGLQEKIKERSARLTNSLERLAESDEPPNYVAYLQNMTARELVSTLCLPQVNGKTSIIVALRALKQHPAILVRISGTRRDYLLSRTALVEYVVGVSDLFQPISNIVDHVPELPKMSADETLAQAMHTMLIHGCAYCGATNGDGSVFGVVSSQDIEDELMEMVEQELPATDMKDQFREMEEVDGEEGVTAGAVEAKKNERTRMRTISRMQRVAQEWVEAAWTEIMILLLVLLDFSLTIYELTAQGLTKYDTAAENPLNIVTGSILFVFAFEAMVRLYGFRFMIFYRVLDVIDLMVVAASILVFLLVITDVSKDNISTIVTTARVMRFLRLVKIIKQLRKMVKANKNRYQRHGFNLDLSFVTPQCIAMSVPAVGMEATYRNPIEEMQRFFQTLHPDRYRIFNACPERQYDHSYFNGRVEALRVNHHHPPTIEQILEFLHKTSSFLDEDPLHVVAVHCLSGLSRTGVLVCSWLMHSTFSQSAEDAMEWFAKRRKGSTAHGPDAITQPSQRRYVFYIEDLVARGGYRVNRLTMHTLLMKTIPNVGKARNGCTPSFTIEEKGYVTYDHKRRSRLGHQKPSDNPAQDTVRFDDLNITVEGDVRVTFFDCEGDGDGGGDRVIFFFWFHTGFVEQECTVMSKSVIDMACADRKGRIFHPDFQVEMLFESVPIDDGSSENFVNVGQQGESLDSVSAAPAERSGTELGSWIRLEQPSQRIIEMAQRNRGLTQVSLNRGEKVTVSVEADSEQQEFSLVPVPGNLCSAPGTPVLHKPVEMFQYAGAQMHAHKHSKKVGKTAFNPTDFFARAARSIVSGQKKRFQEDGFDLDLTYITPRLIAMGFPSSGMEKQYRNSEDEVYRFFQERHAGHYRIVNLCSERAYDLNLFHGSVMRYPFPDHNPPAMELIWACCCKIHEWLQEDGNNVVAIHCKAGKGRTGLMLVSYLMFCGLCTTALQARAFYDTQRTRDKKGLTIISQIRYCHYFEAQLRRAQAGEELDVRESDSPAMRIVMVMFHRIPKLHRDGGCDPILSISVKTEASHDVVKLFSSGEGGRPQHVKQSDGTWTCRLGDGVRVAGDVQLHFADYDTLFKPQKICQVWLHTHFFENPPPDMCGTHRKLSEAEKERLGLGEGNVESLTLHKHEIDGAAADRKNVKFDPEFKIEVLFKPLAQRGTGPALESALSREKSGESVGGHSPSGRDKAAVLYYERDAYEKDRQQRAIKGHAQISFEEWQEFDRAQKDMSGHKARGAGAMTPGGKMRGALSKKASVRTPPQIGTPKKRESLSRVQSRRRGSAAESPSTAVNTSQLAASLAQLHASDSPHLSPPPSGADPEAQALAASLVEVLAPANGSAPSTSTVADARWEGSGVVGSAVA